MKKTVFLILLIPFLIISIIFVLPSLTPLTILNPTGMIAQNERTLIINAVSLMFIIIIPVFIAMFFIVLRYQKDNPKAKYMPNWTGNNKMKIAMWLIPILLISVLAVTTWKAAHILDPYRSISSGKKPIVIQVIALNWKWLFIYPVQKIATVNFVQFPVDTPVEFRLTAGDAPMNSFWIPALGGQMYAMQSMETQLHLISSTVGDFDGKEVEINGDGYSGMKFIARVSTQSDFNSWVSSVKNSSKPLSDDTYNKLSKPSQNNPQAFYSTIDPDLYNKIIYKYMYPTVTQLDNQKTGKNATY